MPMHPLDRWLPEFQFVETHAVVVQASAAACIEAAAAFDPSVDRFMNAALDLREAPGRLMARLGRSGSLQNRPRFGLHDFLLLERDGDRALVHGLAGAFWRANYGLRRFDTPKAWAAFRAAGEGRLALSFHTEPLLRPDGTAATRLVTTTRVHLPDAAGLRRFTPYWWLIRPVSGLIRWRILGHIRRAAEARIGSAAASSVISPPDSNSSGGSNRD
jgi:hypothetical protein